MYPQVQSHIPCSLENPFHISSPISSFADKAMGLQKAYLRRIAFFVFEMWLATVFALLILFALASIGRSSRMLEKSYYTETEVASRGDSVTSQDPAEVKSVC